MVHRIIVIENNEIVAKDESSTRATRTKADNIPSLSIYLITYYEKRPPWESRIRYSWSWCL